MAWEISWKIRILNKKQFAKCNADLFMKQIKFKQANRKQ